MDRQIDGMDDGGDVGFGGGDVGLCDHRITIESNSQISAKMQRPIAIACQFSRDITPPGAAARSTHFRWHARPRRR